ncbi:MAG: PHP domain-containing protein [Thermomicrobiales bacterium]|nr:PHP domain-containing protein [Thermomicrobiales bacterium]
MADPHESLHGTDRVDLHLHTLASDGFWTPDTLTTYLAEHDFAVAAVCDHDSQKSVVEAIDLGRQRGVTVIPGVEVTCKWEERQLHILVYGIRPDRDDAAARPFLALMRDIDDQLNINAIDARERFIASGRDLPSLEEIRNGRVLWPFHVLSAVIQDKHAPNLKEAAEMLVSLGGTFTADLPVEAVVAAAHEAGGVCVVAHPGRDDAVGVVTDADLDRLLPIAPMDGLEAHYRSHTAEQTALYREIAERRGLLISCGSDSHAPGKPVDPKPWRAAWCAALLERLGLIVDVDTNGPVWTSSMEPLPAQPPAPAPGPDESQTAEPQQDVHHERTEEGAVSA